MKEQDTDTLLIIDDDTDTAELLADFLEQSGHRAVKCYTAAEGMQKLTVQFDAVFLDIILPDKNGIALLKDIKKADSQMPVIMVTGFKDAENVVSAFREGAFDCLLKPFNYDYLKNDILPKLPLRKR